MRQTSESPALLLNASVLVFLFRALASARNAERREQVSRQLLSLLKEFVPFAAGRALVGDDIEVQLGDAGIWERLNTEGSYCQDRLAVIPIYANGALAGALILQGVEDVAIESVREVARLRDDCATLEQRLYDNGGIIGQSAAIRKLLGQIDKLASRDTTVLIQGESGTGKELVARLLHRASPRADAPFVAINCAAIADALLESELFGHEKGAFTGAASVKKGKVEAAEGGTLFLDEIGELALPLQAKLLRVLQEREVERVGSNKSVGVNIRVLAATNRDLSEQIKGGAFRADLYHRLNVVALRTPPLRARPEDIGELAHHFLRQFGQAKPRITPEALRCLEAYDWPGNVRELANALEHAVVLGDGGAVQPTDLPESIWDAAPAASLGAFQSTVSDAKRDSIIRAYQQAGGDYKGAAKLLGLHPNYLLRLVRNLGLKEAIKR